MLILLVAFSVAAIDQLSKIMASQRLVQGESVAVIKGFFYLTLVYNSGAAFGIFKSQTFFFTTVSIIAVVSIGIYLLKRNSYFLTADIGFALVLGGAIGNLFDRLRLGCVVDFLDFRIWPVFNIADSAITIGVLFVLFSVARAEKWKS
ncbi:MAG: signal peptidase II [Candidatus Omnitrophica bacterium]|nr:signal peptidase II [Candidatus Omnitrophota bacterium]